MNKKDSKKNSTTSVIDDLVVACGLNQLQCGESMFSKVTNIFQGGIKMEGDETFKEEPTTKTTDFPFEDEVEKEETKVVDDVKDSEPPTLPEKEAGTEPSSSNNDDDDDASPKSPKARKSKSKTKKSPKKTSMKLLRAKKKTKDTEKDNEIENEKYADNENKNETEEAEEQGENVATLDDVDAMLADIDIPEFTMSDEDSQPDIKDSGQPLQDKRKAPWKSVDWKERLGREEVYSRRYRPTSEEKRELEVMAESLGASKSGDFFRSLGFSSRTADTVKKLFSGNHSILLTVTPVKWNKKDCVLILLTDGFVLKYKPVKSFNLLDKRYETCQLWDDVDFCERASLLSVTIQIDSSEKYDLEAVDDGENLDTIVSRLEHVMTQHEMFDSDSDKTDILGWQYLRIRKPAFTAAVANDPAFLEGKHQAAAMSINKLDRYNQLAPLHYAVLQEECNVKLVETLLNAGADPNLEDEDGRSAMYYAERNELPREILDMLKTRGGRKSTLAETELRGELFSGVDRANEKANERRERDRIVKEHEQAVKDQKAAEAQAKAEGVQSEMSKNMSALIERGEKIEQMDQKTKDLQAEAKTFGELASQLKHELKNKKWYQL